MTEKPFDSVDDFLTQLYWDLENGDMSEAKQHLRLFCELWREGSLSLDPTSTQPGLDDQYEWEEVGAEEFKKLFSTL